MHWEGKVGGRSMKDVGGAVLAGSSPPFLGPESDTQGPVGFRDANRGCVCITKGGRTFFSCGCRKPWGVNSTTSFEPRPAKSCHLRTHGSQVRLRVHERFEG